MNYQQMMPAGGWVAAFKVDGSIETALLAMWVLTEDGEVEGAKVGLRVEQAMRLEREGLLATERERFALASAAADEARAQLDRLWCALSEIVNQAGGDQAKGGVQLGPRVFTPYAATWVLAQAQRAGVFPGQAGPGQPPEQSV